MEFLIEHAGAQFARSIDSSPILIGTHEGAELRLDEVDGVNRRHAVVARYLVGWTIHDLASINGVWVNGKKVRRAELSVGDEITIGRAHISVSSDKPPQFAASDDDSWVSVLGGQSAGAVFASRCRLIVKCWGETVAEVEADGDRLIGASERADVRLPADQGFASMHALLARDSGGWYIHDLRTPRGVFHRGSLVGTGSLADGDLVQLGDYEISVELVRDAEKGAAFVDPSRVLASDASMEGSSGSLMLPAMDSVGSAFDVSLMQIPPLALERAQQAKVSMRLGYHDQAVRLLTTACKLSPWTPVFRKQLRVAQRKAIGRDPSATPPRRWNLLWHQWRAFRAIHRGRLEAALHRTEQGLVADPWNRGLLLLQARVFESKQLFDLSLWSLMGARMRAPLDPTINRPAAKLFYHLGAFDKCIAFWNMVKRVRPEDRDIEREIKRVMVEKTLRGGRFDRGSR